MKRTLVVALVVFGVIRFAGPALFASGYFQSSDVTTVAAIEALVIAALLHFV